MYCQYSEVKHIYVYFYYCVNSIELVQVVMLIAISVLAC